LHRLTSSLRHPYICDGSNACLRATAATLSPPGQHSATIGAFCASDQLRRLPAPANTSNCRAALLTGSSPEIIMGEAPHHLTGRGNSGLHISRARWGQASANGQSSRAPTPGKTARAHLAIRAASSLLASCPARSSSHKINPRVNPFTRANPKQIEPGISRLSAILPHEHDWDVQPSTAAPHCGRAAWRCTCRAQSVTISGPGKGCGHARQA
jgi:hypothetical protein